MLSKIKSAAFIKQNALVKYEMFYASETSVMTSNDEQADITTREEVIPPSVGKWAISIAFVRPSACSFVAYIANNSRTQRPSVSKFRRKVSNL